MGIKFDYEQNHKKLYLFKVLVKGDGEWKM